jgi:xylulokinase
MSWRIVRREPRFDPTGVIGLMPHVIPDRYLHEMVVTGSGTTMRWFRSAFAGHCSYADLIGEAADVPRGSDGLLCFPFVEGATVPIQDDAARAAFFGINGHHRRPHFTRAVLEGIAYQYPALLTVVHDRGHEVTSMTISDGEARSRQWNQIKADVLGERLTPSLRVEAPALGAAILAGLGIGVFATVEEGLAVVLELAHPVHPDPDAHAEYTALRKHWESVRNKIYPSLSH